ncbi:hypothetical protein D3C72_1990450 [compost metagenome]
MACPDANSVWPVRLPDSELTIYSTTSATCSGASSFCIDSVMSPAVRADVAAGASVHTRMPLLAPSSARTFEKPHTPALEAA